MSQAPLSLPLLGLVLAAIAVDLQGHTLMLGQERAQPLRPFDQHDGRATRGVDGYTAHPSEKSRNGTDRRWSGEVFLSDNDSPDLIQQVRESPKQAEEPACMSLNDGQSARRYGGCVE